MNKSFCDKFHDIFESVDELFKSIDFEKNVHYSDGSNISVSIIDHVVKINGTIKQLKINGYTIRIPENVLKNTEK